MTSIMFSCLKSLTTFAYKLTTISDYEICRTKYYATNFFDATAMKVQNFLKIINFDEIFLSKQLLGKKGLFRDLVPLFRKLLWIRCMIGFGFFTLIFFCMFNTMGVTAEKKALQTLPPPPSIYVYLFVKWSSFQKVTIYIFLTKNRDAYLF